MMEVQHWRQSPLNSPMQQVLVVAEPPHVEAVLVVAGAVVVVVDAVVLLTSVEELDMRTVPLVSCDWAFAAAWVERLV